MKISGVCFKIIISDVKRAKTGLKLESLSLYEIHKATKLKFNL